jgi:prepilin-type N-terminal cleavage/methylation domain-containing protein
MQEKMQKMREMKKEQGFTLMEMLIVVMIMGFLVAMIAPRFTDMFSGAQRTLCKKDQQTVFNTLGTFVADTGSLPDNLTSIVNFDGTDYGPPSEYDGKNATTKALTDGNDVVKKFTMQNSMDLHILSAAEAKEIKDLGITTIRPFHQNGTTEDYYFGDEREVAAGVGVLMIGASSTGPTAAMAASNYNGQWGLSADHHLVNPEMAYRIVLGLGPDNELVTSGHVDQAGIGLGEAKESKPFKYVYHSLVLPRLESTVDRVVDAGLPISIEVEGYDAAGPSAVKTKGSRTIALNEVQDATNYGLLAVCGEKWQERTEKTGLAVWRITDVTTP